MNTGIIGERNGYLIRFAEPSDADDYFRQNYCPLDPETARLTGSRPAFTEEEVTSFFRQPAAADRCFFLIISPDGKIAGETVISEIDHDLRSACFRIALFHPSGRGKGIGTWAAEVTRDYAFGQLKLHRLELDVYSFNPRAERAYRKAGFRREGVRRDAVMDGGMYADDILMAILEDEWKLLKKAEW